MNKISCIVPAYNEEKRIGAVLRVLQNHFLINEVIAVNDGSKDNTEKVIQKFKVKLISYKKNRGKSYAVSRGIKSAKNNLLMMIDSDLEGLSKKDISRLALPVIKGEADMTISLRKNSLPIYKLMGLDFVSGERVFHKSLIKDVNQIAKLKSYGLEAFLNKRAIAQNLRIKVIYWNHVICPRKSKKVGAIMGFFGDVFMIGQIIRTVGLFGLIYQIIKMQSLKV